MANIFQSERAYDVAEKVAQNEGSGNFSSAGIGFGMMGGVAGSMGAVVSGMTTDALNSQKSQQNTEKNESASSSGSDDMASFKQKIEKLKLMKEAGILSDEEFAEEKKKLLRSL